MQHKAHATQQQTGGQMKKFLYLCAIFTLCLTAFSAHAAAQKTVRIAYVEWPCTVASSNLVKAAIEDRLGHKVDLIPVTAAIMWQSVALGEADACVSAWLPTTHAAYYNSTKDKLDDLGPIVGGARLGWVVPDYVNIASIADLPGNEAKFDGKIYGIDPGAGLMQLSEQAFKDYDLKGFTLMEGSDAIMVAALADAIKNKRWVVVTGWSPHWMFGRWPLKYLDDPKKSLGGEEAIHAIARKGLKDDMPDVYTFLDNFSYTSTVQLEKLMAINETNGKPLENARAFIKENPEQAAAWLK